MLEANHDAYFFKSEAQNFSDAKKLLVWQWEGEDGLSKGYCFHIDLAQPITDTSPTDPLLGVRATLYNEDQNVKWHGIVTSLAYTGQDDKYRYFRVSLEPQWVLAKLDHTSRVHASDTADIKLQDLVTFTLKQADLATQAAANVTDEYDFGDYKWLIDKTHAEHFITDFVCQYEETSYDFLSRHLERAGIYYEFDHSGDREKMIFRTSKQPSLTALVRTLAWRPEAQAKYAEDKNTVKSLQKTSRLAYGLLGFNEYLPEHTQLPLLLHTRTPLRPKPAATSLFGRRVTYGEHYTKQNQGEHIAGLRAKEVDCARLRLTGWGCSPNLQPGDMAVITGLPRSLLVELPPELTLNYEKNESLVVHIISTRHHGKQPLPGKKSNETEYSSIETQWTAIPNDIPFIPERVTPWPKISGLVTGIVESSNTSYTPGEKTESRDYPYLNADGYYRIRFHFAENKQAWQKPKLGPSGTDSKNSFPDLTSAAPNVARNSGWVRLATPYAGSSGANDGAFGMYFPLNEGAEVLVSFLNGDPDRPVMIGAVPNADNRSLVYSETPPVPAETPERKGHPTPLPAPPKLTATTIPNKIAGITTQGGNVLAFNLEENNQTIALSSPVADSYIILGGDTKTSETQGIALHSEQAIILHGNEKVEVYREKGLRRIYDITPPVEKKAETEAEPSDTWADGKKTFNNSFAKGSASFAVNKPDVSVAATLAASVSAKASLDFSLKLGIAFTAVASADWNIGFALKTDVNFLAVNRTKKAEEIKTAKRTALILEDELKAGKRIEKIIRREAYTESNLVSTKQYYRSEAGEAIVISVRNVIVPDIPTQADLAATAAPKGLLASLVPDLTMINTFAKVEPPAVIGPSTDTGTEEADAFCTLRLTKTDVELKAKEKMELTLKDESGTMSLTSGKSGSLTLKGGDSSITLGTTGLKASSDTDASITAKKDVTIQATAKLFLKSQATVDINSSGLMSLNSSGLIKLG